jgi:glycerol kinase
VPGARAAAERGELAFGTVDSFLLWRLTGGRVHATDATNACRTMLYDIRRGDWDDDLLQLFRIPRAVLPRILDCAAEFGTTDPALLGAAVPIRGIAGDQHAATLGQACFAPGMVKSTYGTGCFALLNTGDAPVASRNRLLTTLAWQLGGKRTYALEGAIFIAGAAVQWLRDGLKLIGDAAETGTLARQADAAQNVIFVPAFVGLGAPHWDAEARGAILGLTRGTGPAEIARAALESVAFQTRDLIEAMAAWWRRTGRCSSCRTCSVRRWTGRRCGRPRRSAPPISPGCRPGCCRRRDRPSRIGGWSGASRPACRVRRRTGATRCGRTRFGGC